MNNKVRIFKSYTLNLHYSKINDSTDKSASLDYYSCETNYFCAVLSEKFCKSFFTLITSHNESNHFSQYAYFLLCKIYTIFQIYIYCTLGLVLILTYACLKLTHCKLPLQQDLRPTLEGRPSKFTALVISIT